VVFVADDTAFNESFATAVERLGGTSWLDQQATPQARQDFMQFDERRQQFRALTRQTRQDLQKIYASQESSAKGIEQRVALKKKTMDDFWARYTALRQRWGGYAGYDEWVAHANNAALGALASYEDWVPAFENLFDQQGRNWPRFYDAVRQLAQLETRARQLRLQTLTPG